MVAGCCGRALLLAGLAWIPASAQRVFAPPAPAPVIAPQPGQKAAPPPPAASRSSAAAPARLALTPAQPAAKPSPPLPDPIIAGHDLDVGTFYYNRGDYVGALARFQDAIYNDPSDPEAYCRDGDTELKLKHALPARVAWQRCLKLAEAGKWADHARHQLAKHAASPGAGPSPPTAGILPMSRHRWNGAGRLLAPARGPGSPKPVLRGAANS